VADDDDGDWFEDAFEESDGDSPSDAEPPDESESATEPPTDDGDGDTEPASDRDADSDDDPKTEPAADDDDDEAAESTDDDGTADDLAAGFEGGSGGDTPPDTDPSAGSDPDDFADAFGGGGGGGAGASSPGGGGGDDELFEDDFADAFGGGGGGGGGGAAQMPGGEGGGGSGGDSFGFDLDDGTGAGDTSEFEDEDFDTDIPRIDVGIDGLDEMIQGGLPERSLMVAIGEAGTGKTTFGLQFLHEAIQNGERAVFITLEESRERVVQSADEKGWNFSGHTENGDLAVIDIDPIEMANSLTSIRNELPRLVEDFGASRLVLDSVSLLEMMYDDQSTRRTEIYDFTKSLKEAGVTTMLTSEASEDNSFASRFGIIEYLTDAVVVLRYIRPEDFRETRLAVEIQKIRDANHSRETKPYEITHEGISVYRQANIF
jgi:KaiC domain protein